MGGTVASCPSGYIYSGANSGCVPESTTNANGSGVGTVCDYHGTNDGVVNSNGDCGPRVSSSVTCSNFTNYSECTNSGCSWSDADGDCSF